ncbi:MAG: hypothetical protein P8Z30_05735, partial [Acidobacteriota bacterium]
MFVTSRLDRGIRKGLDARIKSEHDGSLIMRLYQRLPWHMRWRQGGIPGKLLSADVRCGKGLRLPDMSDKLSSWRLEMNWYQIGIREVFQELGTSEKGLTEAEA